MRAAWLLALTCCAATSWLLLATVATAETADEAAAPTLNLDPAAVRDAIANILRDGAVAAESGDDDGGYAEAAEDYLEHVQALLAAVKSPTEVYIREQLADLETLQGLLAALEATSGRPLAHSAVARLAGQLVKGPARPLLLNGADVTERLADAAAELRRFLDAADTATAAADNLRRHADGLPAGSATREYLDGVLDRMLELDGRQAKFSVEYAEGGGEPRVIRAPDDDNKAASSSADPDGRGLFDQVLRRLAAASVADRLRPATGTPLDGGGRAAAAIAHIGELRGRRYRPAGLEVILETIEQCLEKPN